jgi:hypothetical protein
MGQAQSRMMTWPGAWGCTMSGGALDAVRVAADWNAPSGDEKPGREKGGDHAICGAVPGGVPSP